MKKNGQFKKGQTPWNKGLTKNNSDVVKSNGFNARKGQSIKCKYCKNAFYVSRSRLEGRHKRSYCSKQCFDYSQRGVVVQKESLFRKGQAAWNKGLKSLRRPWNKGFKKGRQIKLPFFPVENKTKYDGNQLKCLQFDRYTCTCCGSNSDLAVHHRDHNGENHNFDNLITLCRSCHASVHNTEKNLRIKLKKLGFDPDILRDQLKVVGNYLFRIFDQDGKFVRRRFYRNLVPTVARAAMADQFAGVNSAEMEAISIELGTGTTPPANGDTALETPTHRKAISSAATSNNVATLSVNFTVADLALGGTTVFKEAGIIGDGSSTTAAPATPGGAGILYSRVAISVSVSVTESITTEFTYTYT